MAYQISPIEPVSKEMRRILGDEIDDAISHLTAATRRVKREHFHEARKDLKRARALLRLVRDSVGKESFRRDNGAYRDIAAAVSNVRDEQVLPLTLAKLIAGLPKGGATAGIKKVRLALVARGRRAKVDRGALEAALAELKLARTRIDSLTLSDDGWSGVATGLKRTYRQARKGFREALAAPGDHSFHEWRKQVKYFRHGVELVEGAWEGPLEALAVSLRELAVLLGDDHDLAVLRLALSESDAEIDARARKQIFDAIAAKQKELRAGAEALGDRIFAEKPKAFTERLHEYWKAPQSDRPAAS